MADRQTSYILRGFSPDLWRAVKIKAATKGETIRQVLLRALENYVKVK